MVCGFYLSSCMSCFFFVKVWILGPGLRLSDSHQGHLYPLSYLEDPIPLLLQIIVTQVYCFIVSDGLFLIFNSESLALKPCVEAQPVTQHLWSAGRKIASSRPASEAAWVLFVCCVLVLAK